ncbi:MAG: transporter [Acidobacteriota bacterium]|nr:transporter [Acidobacteriota bacterium]
MKRLVCALVLLLAIPAGAAAQQRPLVTEDPEVVGPGQVLVELGVDRLWDARYPLSGLKGTLLRVPALGISVGLGIAEIQIDGALLQRLQIDERFPAPFADQLDFTGDTTSSIDDFTIGTKIRFMTEAPGRAAIGMRVATKLPMARNERGLGRDTTDFYASLLLAKTIQSLRVVGNAGIGILGDATRGDRQNDVLTYGLSVARALTQGSEVVGEINGRLHTGDQDAAPGTGSSTILRGGLRFTKGPVRIDGGALVGIAEDDPKFGVTAGLTWVFNAFRIQ